MMISQTIAQAFESGEINKESEVEFEGNFFKVYNMRFSQKGQVYIITDKGWRKVCCEIRDGKVFAWKA